MLGLWGWETGDDAVRVYYRSYDLPAIPDSCADAGGEEEAPADGGDADAGGDAAAEDEAEDLPQGAECVCPPQNCSQFATAENATLCDIPPCCLPPEESASGTRSLESSPESTDGTDPDTVSDTDSSTSDESTVEPDVVSWDSVEDMVIDDGDFDDVPDDVKADIAAEAASRTSV